MAQHSHSTNPFIIDIASFFSTRTKCRYITEKKQAGCHRLHSHQHRHILLLGVYVFMIMMIFVH